MHKADVVAEVDAATGTSTTRQLSVEATEDDGSKVSCGIEDVGLMLNQDWSPPPQFEKCTHLHLMWKDLSDRALRLLSEKIAVHSKLASVRIESARQISVTGCKALGAAVAENPTIKSFAFVRSHLEAPCIDAALSPMLSKPDGIRDIDISENSYSDSGAKLIAKLLLKKQPGLESLVLSNADIRGHGTIAVAQALVGHPTLTAFKIDNNFISDNGLNELMTSLHRTKITHLDVSEANLGVKSMDAIKAALENAECKLVELDISGSYRISPAGGAIIAQGLEKNKSLRKIKMVYVDLGKAGGAAIAAALMRNKHLTHVDLTWNEIGNEGAEAMAKMLRVNRNLRSLGLSRNSIGPSGFHALANALQNNFVLTEMKLEHNTARTDSRIRTLLARNHVRRDDPKTLSRQ